MIPPLRAHDLHTRRRLPSGWHGKLRGRDVPSYEESAARTQAWVDSLTPADYARISKQLAALPVPEEHTEPYRCCSPRRVFRPVSTRALTAARPLLDALGDAVHSGDVERI